jgi:hypothetical protein
MHGLNQQFLMMAGAGNGRQKHELLWRSQAARRNPQWP